MTIINPLPYTLTNGTLADATQVMANFNQIVNNVNANVIPATQAPIFNTAVFTTSGTWTAPANITSSTGFVFIITGGGGGGAFTACGGGLSLTAGGGGAGGTAIYYTTGLTAGQGYTVTIGAGGVGAVSVGGSSANGGNGGASSVALGVTVSASGGSGGYGFELGPTFGSPGGAGGGTTNATISLTGQDGGGSASFNVTGNLGTNFGPVNGDGGGSYWGGGARGLLAVTSTGATTNQAINYGSGGAGVSSNTNPAPTTSAGKSGIVFIYWVA